MCRSSYRGCNHLHTTTMVSRSDSIKHFVLLWIYSCIRFQGAVAISDPANDEGNVGVIPTPQSCSSETCQANENTVATADDECGVWLALSTLPGTGIGMFAGKAFQQKDVLMAAGDHTIPIVDIEIHHERGIRFLWDEYTWNAGAMYMENLGLHEVNVASPGFGAAANSFLDFVNADEQYPIYDIPHGLHRRSDPGAGAFTYHHGRVTLAKEYVSPGDELFVSYGSNWFLTRKDSLGPIPIKGDHGRADAMYRKFRKIFTEPTSKSLPDRSKRGFLAATTKKDDREKDEGSIDNSSSNDVSEDIRPPSPSSRLKEIGEDFWDAFVLRSAWDDSPTMAALPPKEDYEEMYIQTLKNLKKSHLSRDVNWLKENGVCADTMHSGESTIRQAGRGAFASRNLSKGSIILPIPLIHIPKRNLMNMYALKSEPDKPYRGDEERPTRPQLLLNYCLGHRDSTLLLSPYGPVFNLINHNQTLVNVKLQWASPQRSQHNPAVLNMTIPELDDIRSAQLAMELVALRDIHAGEEIFLDYGDEWEVAWQKHVKEWKPVAGADSYVSAFEMNQDRGHVFRTEFEQMKNPYPPNLILKFHLFFENDSGRRSWLKKHPVPFNETKESWKSSQSVDCEIMRRNEGDNRTLYAVVIPKDDVADEWKLLEDVPQEAIFFQDRAYTTDMFLENAFRHDIRIPDEMFPETWKNVKPEEVQSP